MSEDVNPTVEKGGSPPEALLWKVGHLLSHTRRPQFPTHEARRQDSLYAPLSSNSTIAIFADDGGINLATLVARGVMEVAYQCITQFGVRDENRMFPAKGQIGGS